MYMLKIKIALEILIFHPAPKLREKKRGEVNSPEALVNLEQ